ncbi:MAG: Bile acid:sodium symporter [Verrucomicrobiales bacterium]|nr:Bile acid:sodium symporter [Verrucomicrobiales bacterium]
MNDFLATLASLAVLVFAVTSMLSVGLGYTVREIIGPLSHAPGVLRALAANFILVPLVGFAVTRLISLDPFLETGLLLVSMAAGAPFLVKLTQHAEHDVGLSASLLVLLLPATVVYMPLVVPLTLPHATVSAWAIARPLVLTMLAPLAVGLLIKERFDSWAERLRPPLGKASSVALVVLVGGTVLANLGEILNLFGSGAILAAFLLVGSAFLLGYWMGGEDPGIRGVLGLGTAQRNIGAATVVATQGFADPRVLVMVVTASLVGLTMLFPIARTLRERAAKRAVL